VAHIDKQVYPNAARSMMWGEISPRAGSRTSGFRSSDRAVARLGEDKTSHRGRARDAKGYDDGRHLSCTSSHDCARTLQRLLQDVPDTS